MKEKIYTIPVTEAFKLDCECSMCVLEKNYEKKCLEYFLGPSLMEPDIRIKTNKMGFCQKHYELLYNKQSNRLGLGLIIDTHLREKNNILYEMFTPQRQNSRKVHFPYNKNKTVKNTVNNLLNELEKIQNSCIICDKISYTMDRYIDVIFYLYFKEDEFRKLFHSKKGFCLKHLGQLLEGGKKHLSSSKLSIFLNNLMEMQLINLTRINNEINWFTKKFDYKNRNKSWGNSKDSVSRSIQKIVGYSNLN